MFGSGSRRGNCYGRGERYAGRGECHAGRGERNAGRWARHAGRWEPERVSNASEAGLGGEGIQDEQWARTRDLSLTLWRPIVLATIVQLGCRRGWRC